MASGSRRPYSGTVRVKIRQRAILSIKNAGIKGGLPSKIGRHSESHCIGSSVKQPLLLVRLLGHHLDLVACSADGGAQGRLVNVTFCEDHGFPLAVRGRDLLDRECLANSIIDVTLAHPAHHSVYFYCDFCILLNLHFCFNISQRQNATKNLLVGNGKAVVLQKVQIRFGCPFVKHPKAGKLPF